MLFILDRLSRIVSNKDGGLIYKNGSMGVELGGWEDLFRDGELVYYKDESRIRLVFCVWSFSERCCGDYKKRQSLPTDYLTKFNMNQYQR
jgi:hypothetical protein